MLCQLIFIGCFWQANTAELTESNVIAELDAAKDLLQTDRKAAQEGLRHIINVAEENIASAPTKVWYLALGRANYHLGNDDAAMAGLQAAAELDPQWAEPVFRMGILDFYKNRLEPAELRLQQAATLDPDNGQYWYELARVQSRNQKEDAALQSLRQALAADPTHAGALTMASNLLMKRDQGEQAIALYRAAVAKDPDNSKLLYNLGQTYQKLGQHEAALAVLEQTIELQPDDWYALSKVVQECQALGKAERRAEVREQLLQLWASGTVSSLAAVDRYCCEIWEDAGRRVYAFEHFELEGQQALRYTFRVIDIASNRKVAEYALGSFASVNELMREAGRIEAGQRAFHLHELSDDGDLQAFEIYAEEPTYQKTRDSILKIFAGELQPVLGGD